MTDVGNAEVEVPGFKRSPLDPGPLSDLIDALHQLHLSAGYPSTRDLQRDVGGRDAPSHAAIHKVFTGSKVPTWRLVEPLVQAMARRSERDERAEVERIRTLWAKAAHPGSTATEPAAVAPPDSQAEHLGDARSIAELLPDVLDEIEAVGTGKATGVFRIPTGFDDLDALLGGWSPGYLIVIGGRPSSGKTNLLLHFCRAASIKYRLATMLTTGEMNSRELQSRLLSAEAKIPSHYMRTGQMSDDEWGLLAHTMRLMADCPIHIATPPGFEIEQLTVSVNRLVRQAGLKLLLIDSLQWVTDSEALGQVSAESVLRRLKRIADSARIPVIITSHAEKRNLNVRTSDDPMAQLMYSDAIERVADVVILLDRPDQDEPESPYAGEANLMVLKNRNGPTATITVACQLHYCRYVDMAPSSVFGPAPTEEPPSSTAEEIT